MNVELSIEAIEDIIDGGGYGIHYWAVAGVVDEENQTYKVTDGETGKSYLLHYSDITKAIQSLLDREVAIRSDIVDAIALDLLNYEDAHRMDSEAYDVIIQVACFGEVIYG
jgi:hypothetical protein